MPSPAAESAVAGHSVAVAQHWLLPPGSAKLNHTVFRDTKSFRAARAVGREQHTNTNTTHQDTARASAKAASERGTRMSGEGGFFGTSLPKLPNYSVFSDY